MKKREIERKLEKIQTLIEDLSESWPDDPAWAPINDAYDTLDRAGDLIVESLDLMSQVEDEDNEESEEGADER